MSSCNIPDRLKIFNVSNWQPEANKPARYSHGELGYFSIDEERHFLPNKSKLGTLNLPQDCKNIDIDLNAGFEQWKDLPNVQQHLDSMLQWILLNKELLTMAGDFRSNDGVRLDIDFITSRGNLARILNVLSGNVDGKVYKWTLLVTRYRGTVYLSHIEDDRDEELSTYARRVCYWGKRFEVEVTKSCGSECDAAPAQAASFPCSSFAPPPGNEVERYGPLKAYPGFYSVVRFELENHRIALRAEVDAQTPQILDEQQIPRSNYVELKVTTETIARAPWAFTRKRLLPWWCQSIVSGTPLIIYGIRDYDGHVKSIEHVRTDVIPDHVGRENLDEENYMLFLSDMLSWIKNIVCVEDVAVVYAFQWDSNAPSRGVTATALRDVNSFLPEWYVNEMEDYFARVWRQQRRKEEKREMAEVKQREFEELKMKGVRRRIEESWPRTTSSYEPNMRDERSYASEQDIEHPQSSRRYDVSDRGRTTLEMRDSVDEGCYSKRESFQSEDYKREYSKSRREKDVRRPSASSQLAEEWFDRDQTRTQVHSHGNRREKTDKTSRYERQYDEDQDQPQERAWSRKSLTDSSPQRFSGRDYPSFCDDRMSQESRVKRMKRDDARRSRHQDSSSSTSRDYEYPHWK